MKQATVTNVQEARNGDSIVRVEAVQPGAKYPWRAKLVLDSEYHRAPNTGDEVEWSDEWPKAGKPWQSGDGEWKSGGIEYWHPMDFRVVKGPKPMIGDEEVPF